MVVRIVVLEIPSQVPDQGIVRSQDSTERSWFKVSRFCYMLMKYSCDRQIREMICCGSFIREMGRDSHDFGALSCVHALTQVE